MAVSLTGLSELLRQPIFAEKKGDEDTAKFYAAFFSESDERLEVRQFCEVQIAEIEKWQQELATVQSPAVFSV